MEAFEWSTGNTRDKGDVYTMKTFLGIDFGTTQTTVTMIKEGSKSFDPNVVEIDGKRAVDTALRLDGEDNVLLFGRDALDRIHENPDDTFYNFKPYIGSAKIYNSSCKAYTPEDLAQIFLKHLRQKLEKKYFNVADLSKLTDLYCTIGCPASWNEKHRRDLANLAEKSGFPNVTCCDEPFGVIYYYHFRGELHVDKPQNILVYDFGGGTTDIAIEEISSYSGSLGEPRILATTGTPDLGGKNFDGRLKDHFIEKMGKGLLGNKDDRTLENYSKQLKEKLSMAIDNGGSTAEKTIPMLYSVRGSYKLEISKSEFQRLCDPFIELFEVPVHDALNIAGFGADKVDHVILAGGSSRLYYVKDKINALFTKSNILVSPNPIEVIAKGLALYGRAQFVPAGTFQKNQEGSAGPVRQEVLAGGGESLNRQAKKDQTGNDNPSAEAGRYVRSKNKKWLYAGVIAVAVVCLIFLLRTIPQNVSITNEVINIEQRSIEHFNAAIAYLDGLDVTQDSELAYVHFYLAHLYGNSEARSHLDALEGRGFWNTITFRGLSRAQIERAQERARQMHTHYSR